MIHLFRSASVRAFGVAVVGLIAAAVLSGALRLALPFADLLREPVEDLLAEALGLEVEMDRLELSLAGWVPGVRLHGARLIDPASGLTQLSLTQLRLDLDPDASVSALAPRIASLTLVGAHLVVRRGEDGRFSVAGLDGMRAGSPGALTFFLGNGRFLLIESRIDLIDDSSDAPPLRLADVAVRFDNGDSRHQVGATARLADAPRSRLQLAGDLTGPARRAGDWKGTVYASARGGDLASLLAGRLSPNLRIASSGTALEAWLDVADGRITSALARVGVAGLTAWREAAEGEPRIHLTSLGGLVQWQAKADGWLLDAADVRFRHGARSMPSTDVRLRLTRSGGGWSMEGGIDRVDLALASEIAALVQRAPPALAQARAEGLARGLAGRVTRQASGATGWSVRGGLEGVGFEAVGRTPGVRGLAGTFKADQEGGGLELAARGVRVELPWLMRAPIDLDSAAGSVRWRRGADGALRVEAPDLTASNADLQTRSRMSLDLPQAGGGRPFLDLQTDFAGVIEGPDSVPRYIPVGILKDDLIRWLDRAVPLGKVSAGTLIFRGTPGDYPFRGHQGRYLLDFAVEDAVLNYVRDWPPITGIDARVRLDGPSLTVAAKRGRFFDSGLTDVTAHVADLFDLRARAVDIAGRAEGPFTDALRVLQETPLARRFGAIAARFQAQGRSRLDLAFSMPLRKPVRGDGALKLDGSLSWPEDAALALPGWGIELAGLDGVLGFTGAGLSAEGIQGDLWGAPVVVRVETGGATGQEDQPTTRILAEGRHAASVLAEHLSSPLWDQVQGEAGWSLEVGMRGTDLGGEGLPLSLALQSDLRGLAVSLPAPLGKAAGAKRALRLEGRLTPGEAVAVTGAYGDIGLSARLAPDEKGALQPVAALVRLGGPAQAPSGDGLRISGRLPRLDLGPWLAWWDGRPQGAGGGDAPAPGVTLREANVEVGHLILADLGVRDLALRLERRPDGWHSGLTAAELAGEVRVPDRARASPVAVRLSRLDLAGLLGEPGGTGQGRAPRGRPLDPRRAHTLDLRIDNLVWRDNSLGEVSVRTGTHPDGLAIDALDLTGPLMSIRGRGTWLNLDGAPRTELKLAGEGSDLGEFLRRLEFRSLLYKAPATATLELAWPGGPGDFSLAELRGGATADVGEGSLLTVEPGVGRMLGILNLGALRRRLTLDFSDLFAEGYAFEQINGSIRIAGGDAVIERLVIDGPSANVSVAGETDLVEQRLDQVVTVTPRIGSGVAVASAVAAGPLVGAAVYLADRVSGGALDRIGRHQYAVTGPWEDPEIRRITTGSAVDPEQPEAAGSDAPHGDDLPGEDTPAPNLFLEHY